MIGPFTLVSVILVFLAGALFVDYPVIALVFVTIGAGWLGILFATMQRLGREAHDAKADYVARLTGQR